MIPSTHPYMQASGYAPYMAQPYGAAPYMAQSYGAVPYMAQSYGAASGVLAWQSSGYPQYPLYGYYMVPQQPSVYAHQPQSMYYMNSTASNVGPHPVLPWPPSVQPPSAARPIPPPRPPPGSLPQKRVPGQHKSSTPQMPRPVEGKRHGGAAAVAAAALAAAAAAANKAGQGLPEASSPVEASSMPATPVQQRSPEAAKGSHGASSSRVDSGSHSSRVDSGSHKSDDGLAVDSQTSAATPAAAGGDIPGDDVAAAAAAYVFRLKEQRSYAVVAASHDNSNKAVSNTLSEDDSSSRSVARQSISSSNKQDKEENQHKPPAATPQDSAWEQAFAALAASAAAALSETPKAPLESSTAERGKEEFTGRDNSDGMDAAWASCEAAEQDAWGSSVDTNGGAGSRAAEADETQQLLMLLGVV